MSDLYDDAIRRADRLAALHTLGMREAAHRRDLRTRGLTDRQLRWRRDNGRVLRPYRGAYLAGGTPADLLERLAALRLVLPARAHFAFHTAAALHGFGVVTSERVHVLVSPEANLPHIKGVMAHRSVLPWEDPVDVLGLPAVPATRCAIDLARTVRRQDALPLLDAALRAASCTGDELMAEVKRHDGLRGVRQARDLLPLADPRAQCRQESQLRLILHDARLPAPEPQLAVRDEYGAERYFLDLGYRGQRVGVEYDGASHLSRYRMRADRLRHNWLEGQGWTMRYFTDSDLYQRPDLIVETVRAALNSRRSRRK